MLLHFFSPFPNNLKLSHFLLLSSLFFTFFLNQSENDMLSHTTFILKIMDMIHFI